MALAAAIAERKRFEEELTAAERRFRTIFEQAAVGVALIETVTGRFVRVNERFCKLLGYTVEEMGRMTFQAMMPSERPARKPEHHAKGSCGGDPRVHGREAVLSKERIHRLA